MKRFINRAEDRHDVQIDVGSVNAEGEMKLVS
jgi:hypothetical protein